MTKKRKKKQALKSYIICITGGVNYRQTDELICVYAFWAQPFFPQNAMWTDCQLLTELSVQLPKLWSTRGPVLTPLKHYFAIANILCIQSNFV